MKNDLISRSALLKYMEETEISQYIDELNNGNDNYNSTPLYDFVKYMPTAYDVEKVLEELEEEKNSTYERCVKGMFDAVFKDVVKKISNGGKE
jgi:hypothetical protein